MIRRGIDRGAEPSGGRSSAPRSRLTAIMCALLAGAATAGPTRAAEALATFAVEKDAIVAPLAGTPGDAARGRSLVLARDPANCVLCHAVPDPDARFAGDVGPSLAGVGTRLTPAQLRLRIVDSTRLDPQSVMPSYYRTDGLSGVAPAYRGKPILTAQQVEDLVAYLAQLR